MPNVSKRKLIAVVCLIAVAVGFVVFYVPLPSNPFKIERVRDVDMFMGALGTEGGLFRYTDGQMECWLEQDTDGKKTKGEPVSLSTKGLAPNFQFEYGLIGLIRHPGEQKEVWEVYHWAIWKQKNLGGTETRSDWKPAATFHVPLPKGQFRLIHGDGITHLMSLEGHDEQGRSWSATLKCARLEERQ